VKSRAFDITPHRKNGPRRFLSRLRLRCRHVKQHYSGRRSS